MPACRVCSKSFAAHPGKRNIYCSMACYRVAQKRGDYKHTRARLVPCDTCGKKHRPTGMKKRDGSPCDHNYCSRACYLAVHTRKVAWKCKECGKQKMSSPYWAKRKVYCSMACRNEAIHPGPNNCIRCGVLFTPIQWRARGYVVKSSNVTCSEECHLAWISENEERKQKISVAFSGSNHPNWQGGKSMLSRDYRGPGWVALAAKIRERDNNECQSCRATPEMIGRELDVHHIEPFHNFTSAARANRAGNLITFCQTCHRVAENQVATKQLILGIAS